MYESVHHGSKVSPFDSVRARRGHHDTAPAHDLQAGRWVAEESHAEWCPFVDAANAERRRILATD